MDSQAFQLLMRKLEDQDQRLDAMESKIDELLSWKLKLTGATLFISAVGGIFVQVLINKISQ